MNYSSSLPCIHFDVEIPKRDVIASEMFFAFRRHILYLLSIFLIHYWNLKRCCQRICCSKLPDQERVHKLSRLQNLLRNIKSSCSLSQTFVTTAYLLYFLLLIPSDISSSTQRDRSDTDILPLAKTIEGLLKSLYEMCIKTFENTYIRNQ